MERQICYIMQCSPNAVILKEAFTGTTQDRPVWRKLFQRLQPDDVVIFDSVSRMSRNAEEGFAEYEALYQRGVMLPMHIWRNCVVAAKTRFLRQ